MAGKSSQFIISAALSYYLWLSNNIPLQVGIYNFYNNNFKDLSQRALHNTRNLFASQALNFGGRAAEEGEKKLCESDNNMQIDVDFFFFIRIKLSYPSSKGELSASSDRQADRQTACLPRPMDGDDGKLCLAANLNWCRKF